MQDKRTQDEEELRKSNKRSIDILESISDGFFSLDKEMVVTYLNHTAAKLLGRDKTKVLGRKLFDAFPEARGSVFEEKYSEALRESKPIFFETYFESEPYKNWYEVRVFPFEEGISVYFQVITERKRAEEKLNQNLREITLLNKISHLVSSSISLKHMAHATVNGIAEYLKPDLVIFFLKEAGSLPPLVVGPRDSRYKFDSVPAHCVGECLCGLAAQDGQPKYSHDISTDPRCTMLECKEAGLQSFAALPLKSGNQVIGILGLASGTPRDFEKQSQLLETLAVEISLSLRNSLLLEEARKRTEELSQEVRGRKQAQEELRQAKDQLEKRVQERTEDLRRAVEVLQEEVTERQRTEEALKQSEVRLRDLAQQLLVLQEEERQALSWDLQESLGQSIAVLKIDLRTFERKLPARNKVLREEYHQTLKQIDGIVENLRRRAAELSPQMLKDLGLTVGLMSLCESYGIECLFDLDDLSECFSLEDQVSIYRVFQEAMNNVSRHSQASLVTLVAKKQDDRVEFLVEDNGRGFEVGKMEDLEAGHRSIGLAAMSERVRSLGGTFKIESQIGVGTRIFFNIPRTRK